MVSEEKVNLMLVNMYCNFLSDLDRWKRINKEDVVYGLALAESAFLKAYREACMTPKK